MKINRGDIVRDSNDNLVIVKDVNSKGWVLIEGNKTWANPKEFKPILSIYANTPLSFMFSVGDIVRFRTNRTGEVHFVTEVLYAGNDDRPIGLECSAWHSIEELELVRKCGTREQLNAMREVAGLD